MNYLQKQYDNNDDDDDAKNEKKVMKHVHKLIKYSIQMFS